ncbi:MAG: MMPL family transporter, partial [Planctomycetota bacterium]
LIAFVMMFVLKSPSAGLVAMIPNLFPVVIIFGMMGWLGVLVDIGTMMTASVALGVAVDDTIHYLTWYRKGLDLGLNRNGAAMMAYEKCATAMTQTTVIGGLGLAVFAFSTFTPTQRFGTMMLVLLVAALFGDLIFLPAVLSSPLGRFFRGSKKAKDAPADVQSGLPAGEVVDVTLPDAPAKRAVRHDPKHSSYKAS